jgi:hypothetical protein
MIQSFILKLGEHEGEGERLTRRLQHPHTNNYIQILKLNVKRLLGCTYELYV